MVASVLVVGLCAAALSNRYLWPHVSAVERLEPARLDLSVRGPGTLEALNLATLGAKRQGRLVEVAVERSDRVRAGDLLARLDDAEETARLAEAEARGDAARRAAAEAAAEHQRTQAAREAAEASFQRQRILQKKGLTSQERFDEARLALLERQAEVRRAEATISRTQAEIRAAEAARAVRRAELDETRLLAPFDAMVLERDATPGDRVQPGASILRLADPGSLVVRVRLDESAIARLHPGQTAELSFISEPDEVIAGSILRLGRETDTETREFTVDIRPTRLPRNWALGQRATVAIPEDRDADAISVPASYVTWRNGAPGVWMLIRGRARWQAITLGRSGRSRIEVLTGLEAGKEVIAPAGVYAWMRVHPAP